MPKTKTKKKALLKIIAITAATTFIVTLLLVWLANFNYLYQKHQADIAGDKSLMSSLELNLNKLASKSGADNDCLKPHWPWSKSSCGSQLDVVYAGSGDLKSDKKLVLDKIRYSGFIPHVSFVSNDVYLDSPPGRTVLTELFATTNMRSDGSDGSHESGLFVTFTKKPYDTSLAEKVKSSKAKYFIVLHVQSGFNSSW